MTTPFTKAAVLEILRTPAASDTFPDMIRRVEALVSQRPKDRSESLQWIIENTTQVRVRDLAIDILTDQRVEALEGCGVRVKALEWEEGKHYGATGRTIFATSIFGTYEVTTGWENGKASAHLSYAETAWLPNEAAAIAFVQDAHETRIRAALEVTP